MDCFGTYFTHAQTCNVTRVESATEWTASVHTVKLWKGCLAASQLKTLQSHAKRRHGLVKETQRCFFVAGGDNKAESRFGAIKGTLRRMNNVGRFAASSKRKKSKFWQLQGCIVVQDFFRCSQL